MKKELRTQLPAETHGFILQLSDITDPPEHGAPPFDDGGELHDRNLNFLPAPHVAPQADQLDHDPQFPLTGPLKEWFPNKFTNNDTDVKQ